MRRRESTSNPFVHTNEPGGRYVDVSAMLLLLQPKYLSRLQIYRAEVCQIISAMHWHYGWLFFWTVLLLAWLCLERYLPSMYLRSEGIVLERKLRRARKELQYMHSRAEGSSPVQSTHICNIAITENFRASCERRSPEDQCTTQKVGTNMSM